MHSRVKYLSSKVIKTVTGYEKPHLSLSDAVFNEIKFQKLFYEASCRFCLSSGESGIKIPMIIDFDLCSNTIIMERLPIEAYSLLEKKVALPLLTKLAKFLDYCEEKGLYHNDLTEENIFFTDSEVWLIDFGMSDSKPVDGDDFIPGSEIVEYFKQKYGK